MDCEQYFFRILKNQIIQQKFKSNFKVSLNGGFIQLTLYYVFEIW